MMLLGPGPWPALAPPMASLGTAHGPHLHVCQNKSFHLAIIRRAEAQSKQAIVCPCSGIGGPERALTKLKLHNKSALVPLSKKTWHGYSCLVGAPIGPNNACHSEKEQEINKCAKHMLDLTPKHMAGPGKQTGSLQECMTLMKSWPQQCMLFCPNPPTTWSSMGKLRVTSFEWTQRRWPSATHKVLSQEPHVNAKVKSLAPGISENQISSSGQHFWVW